MPNGPKSRISPRFPKVVESGGAGRGDGAKVTLTRGFVVGGVILGSGGRWPRVGGRASANARYDLPTTVPMRSPLMARTMFPSRR